MSLATSNCLEMEEKAVFMNPGLILLVFDMGKMRVDLNVDNWINWIFWDILGVFVYLILGQTFWDCLRDCLRLRIWFFRMFTLTPLIPIVGWGMVITGTRWNWGHGNRSRRIYWHWAPWLGQHFWNWQANIGIFNILQYSSNIFDSSGHVNDVNDVNDVNCEMSAWDGDVT